MSATDAARPPAAVERIKPLFFSGSAGLLYACHHAPLKPTAPAAVVLCPPGGHEYNRCHRALRQLAALLAKQGYHVFRFDYYGTGDSAGDYEAASLEQWRHDIATAIAECRQRTVVERVGLIGLRLGATLALQAAAGRTDLSWLVMWSPIFDGRALLVEWSAAQREFARALGHPWAHTIDQVLGMPLTAGMTAELSKLDVSGAGVRLSRALICHDAAEQSAAGALGERLRGTSSRIDVRTIEPSAIWRQEPLEPIVPFSTLRTIVEWVDAPT
jgi:uncharacterized protein